MLGEDYRLVNYNVWKYWLLVYGGGPSIGRASKDIYSKSAIGAGVRARTRFDARRCQVLGASWQDAAYVSMPVLWRPHVGV